MFCRLIMALSERTYATFTFGPHRRGRVWASSGQAGGGTAGIFGIPLFVARLSIRWLRVRVPSRSPENAFPPCGKGVFRFALCPSFRPVRGLGCRRRGAAGGRDVVPQAAYRVDQVQVAEQFTGKKGVCAPVKGDTQPPDGGGFAEM